MEFNLDSNLDIRVLLLKPACLITAWRIVGHGGHAYNNMNRKIEIYANTVRWFTRGQRHAPLRESSRWCLVIKNATLVGGSDRKEDNVC